MKEIVTLFAVGALVFAGYKLHTDQVKSAADQAAAAARSEALREGSRKKTSKPGPLDAVALSRVIEPLYKDLISPLDQNHPADLVPQLQITRERILDIQAHAEGEKKSVYAQSVTLIETMIAFAEERTKALESLIRAAKGKSSLDSPTATSSSSAFFAQTSIKRWEDEKSRRKPALDQLFAQLRNTEREWNKRVGKDAAVERYDLPDNTPVYVNIDAPVTAPNPLERRAYDQRRTGTYSNTYSWRRAYYDRYGYPQ
ncbi:hypothetical protein ACXR0O_07465 [Verrucomicrobiota bacterium sgz303538]